MSKLLTLLVTLFISCATTSQKPTSYVPKFKAGDCALFNPERLKEGQYTEQIPVKILDVGQTIYFGVITHPKVGTVSLFLHIKRFDKDFNKVDCAKLVDKKYL